VFGHHFTHRVVVLAAVCAIAFAGCSIEDTKIESSNNDSGSETTQAAPKNVTASIGDTVTAGDMAFTLNSVRVAEGDEFFSPEPGEKWVVFDGTWENRGSENESVSSLMQFEWRVAGRSMDMTIMADLNGSLDGDVLPGSSLSGEIAFDSPVDTTEGELLVTVDIFGDPVAYKVSVP
jgi:hypothetical protein